jgi:hypothetical protein
MNEGDYQLWPFVKLENGKYSIPDYYLKNIYDSILKDGKLDAVFYDEPPMSFEGFLQYMKSPLNHVVFVINKKTNAFVFIAWLNGMQRTFAYSHFTSIGNKTYRTFIGKMVLKYWNEIIDIQIVGITPETYTAANKVAAKIGYKAIGTVPNICFMRKENKFVGGVISYFQRGGT